MSTISLSYSLFSSIPWSGSPTPPCSMRFAIAWMFPEIFDWLISMALAGACRILTTGTFSTHSGFPSFRLNFWKYSGPYSYRSDRNFYEIYRWRHVNPDGWSASRCKLSKSSWDCGGGMSLGHASGFSLDFFHSISEHFRSLAVTLCSSWIRVPNVRCVKVSWDFASTVKMCVLKSMSKLLYAYTTKSVWPMFCSVCYGYSIYNPHITYPFLYY